MVFASNLLEHLSRADGAACAAAVRRVLKPGGSFIVVQPNFKYCAADYFDDFTHTENIHTHVSMADFLEASGFRVGHVEGKFLPFSMRSGLPTASFLAALYLRSPWRPFAGQMLVVAKRLP